MTFPFPPLWMTAEDGTPVDVSGIYWFVIAAFLFVTIPIWGFALKDLMIGIGVLP